ncbi:MAG: hypothetical protein O3A53_03700 [Acidobacteria bacterium]|nr:hypothetical protein [Acidobacteriota bacterium]MDA1233886.1 hypothetical protein [Acidobacteriota bacterium]
MLSFTKRQFLRLAGLLIADGIIPRHLAAQAEPTESDRKLVIVTFGGGVRYSETFAPDGLHNIPRLREMQPEGMFFKNCVNSGVLSHYNSTSSIVTGNWQRVDDFGFARAQSPTLFEYYRKASGAPATDVWAICTNKSFASMGAARSRDYGEDLGANVVLPKQLLLEAVEGVIKRDLESGVANRENVLNQLENILNAGYEGIGWTIFRGGRELDKQVKDTLTRSLVTYIYGPEAPTSGDELTYFISQEIMREFAPRVMLVNFWDMDVAHWGSYSLYLQAITKTDRLCGMLWDEIQSNPAYKDKTTLLILPELGRDGDMNTANGFLNHRSGDASCRNVWMMALGAGIATGATDRPIGHVDIAATAAEMLGYRAAEEIAGKPVPELL